jgi:hypothetical protein
VNDSKTQILAQSSNCEQFGTDTPFANSANLRQKHCGMLRQRAFESLETLHAGAVAFSERLASPSQIWSDETLKIKAKAANQACERGLNLSQIRR